ncbi:MAG: ABC transporter substrate-binding protein [Burkholderiales bacterium]|jgi:multiple sugar transport system substrate-binding protein
MRRRDTLAFLGAAGTAAGAGATVKPEALRVRWMFSSGAQRDAMVRLTADYAKQRPVTSIEMEQAAYKSVMESALREAESESDVMLWFAGERLGEFVRQGLIEPLGPLARSQGWSQRFGPAMMSAVQVDGEPYAVPLSTYAWGFFYRRSVFARMGLSPPQQWDEFLAACALMRREGLTPIALGGKDLWPLAAWFSQISLRLHGRAFHAELMAGRVSYSADARVRRIFEHWQLLHQQQAFGANFARLDWRAALPYVSRGLAGMVLAGGFAGLQFPAAVREDIGYFRFPTIDPRVLPAEEAPLDVMLVPRNAANKPAAFNFLRYLAEPQVQSHFNAAIGLLPPHQQAAIGSAPWVQAGARQLAQARGVTQFFDRDSPGAFAQPAMAQLLRFLERPAELPAVLLQLDELRRKHYGT